MTDIDTPQALAASAAAGGDPPEHLTGPLKALWLTKADRWHEAHELAQQLDSKMGDWIHALLHLIEGDLGNSAYWYNRVGKPQANPEQIDEEWHQIALAAFESAKSS